VLAAMVGQQIAFVNNDQSKVQLVAYGQRGKLFASPLQDSKPLVKSFTEPGRYSVGDDARGWMRGHVVVTAHPFIAVTNEQGRYAIHRVPAGKHELEAWHESYGSIKIGFEVKPGATVNLDFRFQHPPAEVVDPWRSHRPKKPSRPKTQIVDPWR